MYHGNFYFRFIWFHPSPVLAYVGTRHILYLSRYLARDNEVAVTAVLGDGREEEPITVQW